MVVEKKPINEILDQLEENIEKTLPEDTILISHKIKEVEPVLSQCLFETKNQFKSEDEIRPVAKFDNPIISWVRARVINNDLYCLLGVHGRMGVGKSCTSLYLSLLIDPTFTLETMKERVVNSSEQFLTLINNTSLPRGACIIWDDAGAGGIASRDFMTRSNKLATYVIQTIREKHLVVFITTPSVKFIDVGVRVLFDAIIEPIYRDPNTNRVRIKFKRTEVNATSGKVYNKFIVRSRMSTYNYYHLSRLHIAYIREYKRIRREFTDNLNKSALAKLQSINNINELPLITPVTDIKIRCPGCNSTRIKQMSYGSDCQYCHRKYATYPPIKDVYASRLMTPKESMNSILTGKI